MSTRYCAWLCLFCLSCFPAFAQANGHVPAAKTSREITLDVVVADKSGQPVRDLQQQDFTLLDNKAPQKINSFHEVQRPTASADPPVEVILLVDEVNASFTNAGIERQAVGSFLKQNGAELARPVSLVFFSDATSTIGTTPTQDGKALIAELNQSDSSLRTIRRAQGVYGAADRVQLSLSTLGQLADYEAKRPGRKLVIWISPGWPLLSGPNTELGPKAEQEIFNSIVTLSNGLREARITLYSVDPLGTADAVEVRTSYYKEFLKGVSAPQQVQIGDVALQVLAAQSGGRVLNSSNDVAGEIATCIADANAFYVLSFEGEPGDGPNQYHALEVKIDKPGITARTRTGYYAQPEQAGSSSSKP